MKAILYLSLILCSYAVHAQTQVVEEILEYFTNSYSGEVEMNLYADALYALVKHPIDLNECDQNDLEELSFLSLEEIESIIKHRTHHGPFLSHLELQVCGIPKFKIIWLSSFSVCETRWKIKDQSSKNNHVIVLTSQMSYPRKNGLYGNPSKYSGNPIRQILRYRGSIGKHVRLNYTGEKDAGEQFLVSKGGFDFHSVSMECINVGRFKKIILGDYQLGFGQGLNVGNGLMNGKSSMTTNVMSVASGLKSFRSLDENQYMRGIAATWHHGNFEMDGWVHRNFIDANILRDSSSQNTFFSSRQTSGLHRTSSELEDKNSLLTQELGFHGKLTKNKLILGLTYFRNTRGYLPITYKNNQDTVIGSKHAHQTGFYIKKQVDNGMLFFEIGTSFRNELAFLMGGLWKLSKAFSVSAVMRYIPNNFNTLHSNTFTESSRGNNEQGFYLGCNYKIASSWTLSAYSDTYVFPKLSFNASGPIRGNDYLVELRKRISRNATYYIRYKTEIKTIFGLTGNQADEMNTLLVSSLRNHLAYQVTKHFKIQTRLEINKVSHGMESSKASLLYQDFGFALPQSRLKFKFRFALSYIPNYRNRIYTYEQDVAYAYSVPSIIYSQTRSYCLIQYHISHSFDAWLKAAIDYKSDGKDFGSGLDSVSSPYRSDIKFQIRWHI